MNAQRQSANERTINQFDATDRLLLLLLLLLIDPVRGMKYLLLLLLLLLLMIDRSIDPRNQRISFTPLKEFIDVDKRQPIDFIDLSCK